jgi:hypothetical protein
VNVPKIDWSGFTWPISDTCTCMFCDTKFRSHAKAVYDGGNSPKHRGIWSKDPCPKCGEYRLKKIESDPESWSLK